MLVSDALETSLSDRSLSGTLSAMEARSTAAGIESDDSRHAWGQAYCDGLLVCSRVHITLGRGDRLGLA
jgi:hypothetical protein